MSHVVSIDTQITDLTALEAACAELGLTFKKGQRTYAWWGRHLGDYPLPVGVSVDDLGKCDHAIGVFGTPWEIGLVRNSTTGAYSMLYDFYGPTGAQIVKVVGEKGGKLLQMYGVCKTMSEATKNGYTTERTTQADGSVKLLLSKSR